ncbi:MAG TPA: sulfatase [Thermoleophilaceae bacterium]|nr:sulfatase [Thermoleophilaceae bacterium]
MRRLALLCLPVFALLLTAGPAMARPNVVVLMTDDQTLASLSSMPQTNALLAAPGTTFEQATSTFPLCCPSRATALTGQYSHNHQILHNVGDFGGHRKLSHANTLPVWLQGAGYRTMHVGRYLNGYEYSDGVPPGWDEWHGAPHSAAFNYTRWRVNENGSLVQYPVPDHPGEYLTDYHGRRASELIERAAPGEQPFYLQVWFVAPHTAAPRDPDDPRGMSTPSPAPRHRDAFAATPMPLPPSFNEAAVLDKPQIVSDSPLFDSATIAGIEENWRQERESLLAVDDAVAQIVGTLERSGELANTLIVYTSDNGYMHGEHRAKSGKVWHYEPSSRVPLIMRGPGVPAGLRDRRPVANIDVAPTIVDAADAQAQRVLDGRSLFGLIADPGVWWGRDILLENGRGANSVPPYRAIRTGRFVYVQHLSTGEYELYDLERDPYQLDNLDGVPRYAAVQRDLAGRLRLLRHCAGRGCQKAPGLRLGVRSAGVPVEPGRCARGTDLRLRLAGRDRERVTSAVAFVRGRRVARMAGGPISQRIRRPRIRPGRRYVLRVKAELRDGRIYTLDRRLRACR